MSVKQRINQVIGVIVLIQVIVAPSLVAAQSTTCSSNYCANETQFGSGGNVTGSSTNFKGQSSLGSLGGGQTSSANFTANAGFLTQNEPYLEVGVISGQVNLGNLVPSATGYGSGSFYVRAYTASGYTIQILGSPPKNAHGTSLKAKTTLGAPTPGTEEFGMNVVANPNFCGTSCTLGADPVPVPDSTFAFGAAATGYSTPGQFKYVSGNTIASAPKGNGQTNFTLSYIADITSVTEAGFYTMNQDLVIVASFWGGNLYAVDNFLHRC